MTETAAPPIAASDDGLAAADATPPDAGVRQRWHRHPAALLGGLVVVGGAVPLAVALVQLRSPHWFPVMDQAAIELRVRDVGEGNLPLVGLPGRISGFGQPGSHPGPLMFVALFPVYWLLGSTAWALQVATASLNLAAMAVAVWIGHRRGGVTLATGVALTMVLLARSYGVEKLTVVWNPYIQVLWWMVFLLAVWSVLCDDLALLPVAVFAGSFCLQAHYPYLGPVGAVGALAAVALVGAAVRQRADRDRRRRLARWVLPSLLLLGVLWLPPVIDELTNDPGNLAILREAILNPTEPQVRPGLGHTTEIWLAHLNPGGLLSHTRPSISLAPDSPVLPGLLLVAAWLAAAVVAWRRRERDLLRLHLVVVGALAAGFVSIDRIPGDVWDYLVLWAWGTTALAAVAVVLTIGAMARASRRARAEPTPTPTPTRPWPPAVPALAAGLVVVAALFTHDAADARNSFGTAQSDQVARLAPDTVAALREGDLPGGGDGRYLVLWNHDALWIGMSGFGFYLELERSGIDVGVAAAHAPVAGGDHRVLDPSEADAAIHLVIGTDHVDRWDSTPGAVRVAHDEPRTEAEVAELARLRGEVTGILREHDRSELVPLLDRGLAALAFSDPPAEAVDRIDRMLELGMPAAVFVAPVGVQPSV